MTYNYVTVTYDYTTDGTTPAPIGRFEWYPSGPVTDLTNHVEIDLVAIEAQLDENGIMSAVLFATDNTVSDFTWIYVPHIEGEEAIPVAYQVEHANGASQTLDSLTAV